MLNQAFILSDHKTRCDEEDAQLAILISDNLLCVLLYVFELLHDASLTFVGDNFDIFDSETLFILELLNYLLCISLCFVSILTVYLLLYGIVCEHLERGFFDPWRAKISGSHDLLDKLRH